MHKIYTILALFFLLGAAFASPSMAEGEFRQDKLSIQTAGNKTINFGVEVADTEKQREQGFQHRTSVPEDHGMLFVFDEDSYIEMWMKDTPVSLDMVFIDNRGKIVFIAPKTKPESTDIISAKRDARAVLELAAGVTEKQGIKVGDQVVSHYFKP